MQLQRSRFFSAGVDRLGQLDGCTRMRCDAMWLVGFTASLPQLHSCLVVSGVLVTGAGDAASPKDATRSR